MIDNDNNPPQQSDQSPSAEHVPQTLSDRVNRHLGNTADNASVLDTPETTVEKEGAVLDEDDNYQINNLSANIANMKGALSSGMPEEAFKQNAFSMAQSVSARLESKHDATDGSHDAGMIMAMLGSGIAPHLAKSLFTSHMPTFSEREQQILVTTFDDIKRLAASQGDPRMKASHLNDLLGNNLATVDRDESYSVQLKAALESLGIGATADVSEMAAGYAQRLQKTTRELAK